MQSVFSVLFTKWLVSQESTSIEAYGLIEAVHDTDTDLYWDSRMIVPVPVKYCGHITQDIQYIKPEHFLLDEEDDEFFYAGTDRVYCDSLEHKGILLTNMD